MNLATFTAWRTAIKVARDEAPHRRRRRNYGARHVQFLFGFLKPRITKNEI